MNTFIIPELNFDLLSKYDVAGPRYTSYPTAPQFTDRFTARELREEIITSNAVLQPPPLSLYFHLPFCESVCFFCGCNVTFTADRSRPHAYTATLFREMDAVVSLIKQSRPVAQLHWGGGTPTFFPPEELERLFTGIRERFNFMPDAEIGLEIDPRETTPHHLETLARLGFNRLSMGLQDFDPAVQKAVNRIQPHDLTRDTIQHARNLGFSSISLDLIYGLPFQTELSFARTLDQVIALDPDRLALFNFAYLPELIRHQKAIPADALPSPREKCAILKAAIERLTEAGYRYIGMDHFAKPQDELCIAQDAGTLCRNFQGYSTHAGCDLYAFGVSAISNIGRIHAQNEKNIHEYTRLVEEQGFATHRGFKMSDDDLLRREVITRLMCDFKLDQEAISNEFNIDFEEYFADALVQLVPMAEDGLLQLAEGSLEVTPTGRLLIRNICMAFDAYLGGKVTRFSRTI